MPRQRTTGAAKRAPAGPDSVLDAASAIVEIAEFAGSDDIDRGETGVAHMIPEVYPIRDKRAEDAARSP
ncbi:hypothetical protein PT2222_10357 [Paraburkholderia tropica]